MHLFVHQPEVIIDTEVTRLSALLSYAVQIHVKVYVLQGTYICQQQFACAHHQSATFKFTLHMKSNNAKVSMCFKRCKAESAPAMHMQCTCITQTLLYIPRAAEQTMHRCGWLTLMAMSSDL